MCRHAITQAVGDTGKPGIRGETDGRRALPQHAAKEPAREDIENARSLNRNALPHKRRKELRVAHKLVLEFRAADPHYALADSPLRANTRDAPPLSVPRFRVSVPASLSHPRPRP
jgi:hypothetical protein